MFLFLSKSHQAKLGNSIKVKNAITGFMNGGKRNASIFNSFYRQFNNIFL